MVTTPTLPGYWDNVFKQFEALAQQLHMQALRYEVRTVGELEDRFRAMAAQRVQAVLVWGSPFTFTHARILTDLAAKYRIAGSYETGDPWVQGGGLMAYGVDFVEAFARGAVFVDKIFRGANPAELPVEQPTKFELVINLKTAKALGLTIPPAVLARAERSFNDGAASVHRWAPRPPRRATRPRSTSAAPCCHGSSRGHRSEPQ